ncbi:MAG: L,D-transpeptidase family protein [Alicyclobacillus sp.]|nr:L,D-transpeptidase family protein [Alicyclobacillus sp.]
MNLRLYAIMTSLAAVAGGLSVFIYLQKPHVWGEHSDRASASSSAIHVPTTSSPQATNRDEDEGTAADQTDDAAEIPMTPPSQRKAASGSSDAGSDSDPAVAAGRRNGGIGEATGAKETRAPSGAQTSRAADRSGPGGTNGRTVRHSSGDPPDVPGRTPDSASPGTSPAGTSRAGAPGDGSRAGSHGQSDGDEPRQTWVNWTKPTGGPYPDLSKYHDIWVEVSISKQRTYIHAGRQVIYTMIVSTGNDDDESTATPRGTFEIEPEQGEWFYNPKYQEGAEYWVSFLNHGEYLFHSVPMDIHHHVILSVAKDLGREDSHGCVHLSIPDAKWFYDNIPTGTKVVIHD